MKAQKFYKSDVNGAEFSFDEFAAHGRGGIYKGFTDLPSYLFPYSIIEKQIPSIFVPTKRWAVDFLTSKGFTQKEIEKVMN